MDAARPVLHLFTAEPGTDLVEAARLIGDELCGHGLRAVTVDLGDILAADPLMTASQPAQVLTRALDTVESTVGDVVITYASLPTSLSVSSLAVHCQVANALGAGIVLISDDVDPILVRVLEVEMRRHYAQLVGQWSPGSGWKSGNEESATVANVTAVATGTEQFIGDSDGIAEVLAQLTSTSRFAVPGERADILLALAIASCTEGFATPAAVRLTTPAGEAIVRAVAQIAPALVVEGPATGRPSAASAIVRSACDAQSTRPMTPMLFQRMLLRRAKAELRHIVLPEGEEPRIVRAAAQVLATGAAQLTLLGDPAIVRSVAAHEGVDIDAAQIIDPCTSPLRDEFAAEYAQLRAKKGITAEQAYVTVADVSYFGTLMVHTGKADGMVSGAIHTTAHTIKPSFEIIRTRPGVAVVSSVFFMCLDDRVLVFGDCAVNPNPTVEQLADIAISSAQTAAQFGIDPHVALLSYSTGTSGAGPDVDLVTKAAATVREAAPQLNIDGPLQFDAAVDSVVAAAKAPGSQVAGRANVLIFPDLSAGNAAYKAVQRTAGAVAIGPVLQGLNKPVNDLSRGALIEDIVNTVIITAIQAGGRA